VNTSEAEVALLDVFDQQTLGLYARFSEGINFRLKSQRPVGWAAGSAHMKRTSETPTKPESRHHGQEK
jgi:hypothetical protein